MSNPAPPDELAETLYLQRDELLMHDLNARIARLALGLGVALHNEQDILQAIHALHTPAPATERRTAPERGGPLHATSADRRQGYQRQELRGLLVLRYSMELRLVDQLGYQVTQEIMRGAQDLLQRHGIAPDAYGEPVGWSND